MTTTLADRVAAAEPLTAALAEQRRGFRLAALAAIGLGAVLRIQLVLGADFPLNDGGMFYAMARDLQLARYALPEYTSYNGGGIPFAYPPLGFYLAALLDEATPWSLLDSFRILPLLASLLSLAAFARFSGALLSSPLTRALALFAFALLPETFIWMLMGGGVARATGLLFAILAIHQAYLLFRGGSSRRLAVGVVCAGLAVLSHPSMGWFTAYSLALLLAAYGRSRRGLLHGALLAGGTMVCTAPWWLTVSLRHGPDIFLSARDNGLPALAGVVGLLTLSISNEPFVPVLGSLGLLGVLACLGRRHLFLPLWLLAMFVLDSRSTLQTAPLALAPLIGIGAVEGMLPLLNRAAGRPAGEPRDETALLQSRLAVSVLGFVAGYAVFSLLGGVRPHLAPLPAEERAAMAWVAANTPPDSRVLVLPVEPWAWDRSSEWFPVLTGRTSVATVQGSEWLGQGVYARKVEENDALRRCGHRERECLENWARDTGDDFSYIYIPKRFKGPISEQDDCCSSVWSSLGVAYSYTTVYDEVGATIVRRD